jgi:hypothetical protein
MYFPHIEGYSIYQDLIEAIKKPTRESLVSALLEVDDAEISIALEDDPEILLGFSKINKNHLEVCLFVNGIYGEFYYDDSSILEKLDEYLKENCEFILT